MPVIVAGSVTGNRLAHTVFGRRESHANKETVHQDLAKKEKEQGLIESFPAENDIVGDIELELLMMNGYSEFATHSWCVY
jgi:hypothetical protein